MGAVSEMKSERQMNAGFRLGSSLAVDHDITPFRDRTSMKTKLVIALVRLVAAAQAAHAQSTSPTQMLRAYEAEAGTRGRPDRGQAFFTTRHGGEWSCASCHGQVPTGTGRHAVTGKSMDPLAPVFNPRAFTDERRVAKWFRRNCKDVVQRECTPTEKADVLAWLQNLR